MYHQDILKEYREVLSRKKFHLENETIKTVINSVISNGIEVNPKPTGEINASYIKRNKIRNKPDRSN